MSIELVKEFKIGDIRSGVILLKGISFSKTKYGKDMAMFTAVGDGGVTSHATIFDVGVVGEVKQLGELDILANVSFKVDEYNGASSLIVTGIDDVYELTEELSARLLDSIPPVPNIKAISTMLSEHLTEKGFGVVKTILNDHKKELALAMAAQYGGIHDGVYGGLLNHMRKVIRYAVIAMDEYKETFSPEERDLVIIGVALHDIGKIIELKNGSYADISIVPHTFLGIEILSQHQALIEEVYGHMFYRELQAIIAEHHGEFGERPKTVYAYIVHQVDLLDSRVSGLQKLLTPEASNMRVSFDNYKLQFNRYGG